MYKYFFILLTLILFSSCSRVEVQKNSIEQHIDESDELYMMMHNLNSSIYEKNKSELEVDDAKKRYALNIASNITQATVALNRYGHKNLQNENLKNFLSLSDQLKSHALKIESIANSYELEKLDDELEDMQRTCTSCHLKFRGYR
jgi:hypothetical protein